MSKKHNKVVITKVSDRQETRQVQQAHTDGVVRIQEQIARTATPQATTSKPYDFSKIHLCIGMPCYGGMMCTTTSTSLIRFILLATKINLMWSLETMTNESLVQRGRNSLMAKMASNPDVTHFMFIDADIEFEPESIIRMLMTEKDIVSGAYPKKCLPIAYNINLEENTTVQGPLYTVDTAATGFLMYKRKVWQDLVDKHPQWKYKDDIGLGKQYEPYLYSVFDCYIDHNGHYLSEDWAFCRRAKGLGYQIWVDSRVSLNHTGNYTFNGNVELLKIQTTSPTTMNPIITETQNV
jgi:hypothetical protein